MGELVDQLGSMAAGQLIRSEDWNALVAAVEKMETDLTKSISKTEDKLTGIINKAQTQLDEVDTTLGQLQDQFNAFVAKINPLLDQHYRVTMETTRVRYAIGERAIITAQVTDLLGNQLDFADEATRPWIDFVSSWGQLKSMGGQPGVDYRGGAQARTLSVRTDQQGRARAFLRSEFVEGLTEETEEAVDTSMTARLPNTTGTGADFTVAEAILHANTPVEAKNMGTLEVMTMEYDRADAVMFRNYVDIHYSRNTVLSTGRILPISNSWRDYRTIVLAFAKDDSDPTTPDQSRGVSSIQITFRDWIIPWIILEYFPETDTLADDFRERLIPRLTSDFGQSVYNIKTEVNEFVTNMGLVGKQRNYQIAHKALDQMTVPKPPAFLNTLTQSMQDAITIQQALETAQGIVPGVPDQEVAFEAFANVASRGDAKVAGVDKELNDLKEKMSQMEESIVDANSGIGALQGSVGTLNGRVDATLAEGGAIQQLNSKLETVTQQVGVLKNLDVIEVQDKLSEIRVLNDNLLKANVEIAAIKGRIGPG